MTRHVLAIAVALSAIAATPPPLAMAHEGHKVMGTVKSIQEKHLEVLGKDGKTSMFMITDQTKIVRGKTPVSLTDVKVGERVVVLLAMEMKGGPHAMAEHGSEHGGPMTAAEIRLATPAPTGALGSTRP